jgi:hypothetical protein
MPSPALTVATEVSLEGRGAGIVAMAKLAYTVRFEPAEEGGTRSPHLRFPVV